MRRCILLAAAAVLAAYAGRADAAFGCEEAECGFDRLYVGMAECVVMPQGGARMSDHTGAAFRFGFYATEFWAVEGEASWVSDRAGLAARAVWHWWGYERLDPFFTFGARGWVDHGQVGPCAGVGTFYHLDDRLSLRFDADATLGVETDVKMVYAVAAGIQWAF